MGGQGLDASIGAGTVYGAALASPGTTATETVAIRWIAPTAGTISGLRTESKQGATGTMGFTLRKNGVATTVAIAPTAGTAAIQTLANTVQSATVAAGDVITLEIVVATVAGALKTATFRFTPTA